MYFETFREAVMYEADEAGILPVKVAQWAANQGDPTGWQQWLSELPPFTLACEADALLTWLGY